MTDRELLQEILTKYLVFGEGPVYMYKTLGIYYSVHLRRYLVKSVHISEDVGWNWLDTYLRNSEKHDFFTKVRIAYLKGESNE